MSLSLEPDRSSYHVLWIAFPAFSHLKATLGMAEELLRRGHRVTYLVADRLADVVAETGARVVSYRSVFPESLSPPPSTTTLMIEFVRESFAPLEAALACAEVDPPDLIVHDALVSDVAVALGRRYGVPTVRTYAGIGDNAEVRRANASALPEPDEAVNHADPRWTELVAELTRPVRATGTAELFEGGLTLGDDAALNISFVTWEFQVQREDSRADYLFAGPCLRPADFEGQWTPPEGAGRCCWCRWHHRQPAARLLPHLRPHLRRDAVARGDDPRPVGGSGRVGAVAAQRGGAPVGAAPGRAAARLGVRLSGRDGQPDGGDVPGRAGGGGAPAGRPVPDRPAGGRPGGRSLDQPGGARRARCGPPSRRSPPIPTSGVGRKS